jgi:hypothetical protein
MAQAVSRRPLTEDVRVRSRLSPRAICGGQNGGGTGFSPNTSVFPCQFHSTGPPLHGITKKLIVFITGLHSKPQGCGASVASAAGPLFMQDVAPCHCLCPTLQDNLMTSLSVIGIPQENVYFAPNFNTAVVFCFPLFPVGTVAASVSCGCKVN